MSSFILNLFLLNKILDSIQKIEKETGLKDIFH